MEPGSLVPLYRQLDGARFVHFDELSERLFVWNGKRTITVFNKYGLSLTSFDLKGFPLDVYHADEAKQAINDYIKRDY